MHIKKLTCAAGFFVAAGVVGCNTNDLTNLNTNPNNPTTIQTGPMFTYDARVSAGTFVGNGFDLRQTEFVAQHWAEAQYPDEDRYARLDPASTRGTWLNTYAEQLEDLKKISDNAVAAKDPGTYGPAQILSSWNYAYLADTWGSIPYSQSLKGDSAGGAITASKLTPPFDSQKDVYAGLLATLTADAAALTGANNSLAAADPIYGGDPASWAKFANSLRARLAMRLVNVDPTTANAALTAALHDPAGVFTSNADMAQLVYPGDGVYNNPWTDNFSGRDDHRVSQTLATVLIDNADPRMTVMMQPVQDSTLSGPIGYFGMPNGLSTSNAGKYLRTASRPGSYLYPGVTSFGTYGSAENKKNPVYLMTYAELCFIQAEAAERGMAGLTPGDAAGYYYAGIEASMAQFGVTDAAAIAAFEASANVKYKGGTAGLVQIAVQKWVALVGDGAQAWAEWRRTCQPSTIKAGPAAVVHYVPRRFYYPIEEYTLNGASVAAANTAQGPDNFGTRTYWDSKPDQAPTYVSASVCAGAP